MRLRRVGVPALNQGQTQPEPHRLIQGARPTPHEHAWQTWKPGTDERGTDLGPRVSFQESGTWTPGRVRIHGIEDRSKWEGTNPWGSS